MGSNDYTADARRDARSLTSNKRKVRELIEFFVDSSKTFFCSRWISFRDIIIRILQL